MREILIGLMAFMLIGCGEVEDSNSTEVASYDYDYDLWEYVVPTENTVILYDLLMYDEDGDLEGSFYNYVSVEYNYISDDAVTEQSSFYTNIYTYYKSEDSVIIADVVFPRYMDINDTSNDCTIEDVDMVDTMKMTCIIEGQLDIKYYRKNSGLTYRVTTYSGGVAVLEIAD